MGIELLDRTRRIGGLLHQAHGDKVVFSDLCGLLSELLESDVCVISRKGKMLGASAAKNEGTLPRELVSEVGCFVDGALNDRLLGILSTKENCRPLFLGLSCPDVADAFCTVCPVEVSGDRLGSVIYLNTGREYDIDDLILCEYGADVIALEMLRAEMTEQDETRRSREEAKSAAASLTMSERKAVQRLLRELKKGEGIVVAAHIADSAGIARSVLAGAMRKLEGARVLSTKSAGVSGTHVRLLNSCFPEEMDSEET